MVIRAETIEDIRRAKQNGQIAFIPSLEAATPIENELDRLDILYGLGIRSSGIAYSEANTLGMRTARKNDGGTDRVRSAAVERMNKLGIAIDISHSGDQTSLDTIEVSHEADLHHSRRSACTLEHQAHEAGLRAEAPAPTRAA